MNYSDEEIVKRVLAGEKELFGMLVNRYQKPIFNLMLRYGLSRDEAADLAQEAFVRAYDKLRSFHADRRFFPWFYSLSVNVGKDWSRKLKRRNDRQHLLEQQAREEGSDPDQHTHLEDSEEIDRLRKALAGLPDLTREILVLRYRHGSSIREVASAFSLSESAVKMRIKRGLEGLRGHMESN